MSEITEKDYSVEAKWVYKSLIIMTVVFVVSALVWASGYYNVYLIFLMVYSPLQVLLMALRRKKFHYSLGPKFMLLKQGVITRQERNLPYGVIQNVMVKQDILDRMMGIASLSIENAAGGGGAVAAQVEKSRKGVMGVGSYEGVGFSGNKVIIPGLLKANAETLKAKILELMKKNPVEDNQSGL